MKLRAWLGEVQAFRGSEHFGPLVFFCENKELARDHLLHCAGFGREARVRMLCIGWYEDGQLPTEAEAIEQNRHGWIRKVAR